MSEILIKSKPTLPENLSKSKPTLLLSYAPINFIDIINCISLYPLFLTICQCFVTDCLNNLTICPFV